MNCHELATHLPPYLDAELDSEAACAVEAHLLACQSCARTVERERHHLTLVKHLAKGLVPKAPARLHQTVFAPVRADARRTSQRQLARYTVAAASMALMASVGYGQYRSHLRRLYEQDAAMRHARQFPLEVTGTDGIEAWFGGKLDHRVSLPRFPNATVAGARLLQVRDKPAAYIRFERPAMGMFVFGDDHDVEVSSTPSMGNSNGYNVVSWRDGDLVYQLVTELDEDDIRELVPAPPERAR